VAPTRGDGDGEGEASVAAFLTTSALLKGEERRSDAMTLQGQTIRTVSRVRRVRLRGGVWEWHRPVAVEVHTPDGVRRLPIRDVSRAATWAIGAAGLMLGVGLTRRLRARTAIER
jgi:hypothetical protein